MKNTLSEIKRGTQRFRQHWWVYLTLFVSVDLVIQLVAIPVFRLMTTYVLQAGAIPFVSYQNIMTLVSQHPLVVVALLLELVALLLVIYWQFAIVLLGVRDIQNGTISVRHLLKESGQALRQLRFSSLLVLLGYFVLVIPFADLVFRTPLLSKVQIPAFILDFMTRNTFLLTVLILFYTVMVVLGVRYLLALPLMVYKKQRPRVALANSWRLTNHGRWWPLVARILLIGLVASVVMVVFYGMLVGIQCLLDLLPGKLSLVTAIINLTLVQLGSECLAIWIGVVTIQALTTPLGNALPDHPIAFTASCGVKRVLAVAGSLIVFVTLVSASFYLVGTNRRPLTISHRGVAEKNGVQNTIPAMEKTHHLHPDYIEMDIHETKDHQFVVMHDENLKELAGVNKAPYQLTLRQLTSLKVHENGHKAKIASFDDYLKAADRLHQKLLVEVKTTPHDSKDMLTRFSHRYADTLLRHHDQVQSLDYRVVTGMRKYAPQIPVIYIQPYNFTYPNTAANGYSMEYSTLTDDFISLAHLQGKVVYAWTVDERPVMMQEMYNNVDGLITNNLAELNSAIQSYENKQSYAQRILNYIMVIPGSQEFEP
ncbi:MAG: glycerophosphoryl diester phosphodiesterase membrane domain-containing protein [Limosilactobacillus pontis]|uniref:Glycerophosphodiester phosphodiesterase n=1 Tax=Limosilactobacillus pontis TaxID=35787 RepID=A0A2J6NP21_9LACO|nr:glycerophosphodiester phosphodiesterase [Limosilactobacillus pontis]PMB82996.1 glycerophosphodiester phosphodiesterase [Limosilactobacillus pontis]